MILNGQTTAATQIDGASHSLERYRDTLSPEERVKLAGAVSAEIARLQRLITAEQLDEDGAVFPVAEALAPVITGARTQGIGVLVDIDEDLRAHGRWADTAEVVQNLIENARRYARGSPVAVRARRQDDRVLIRVEDRGPGVPVEQREAIFRRSVRGTDNAGNLGSGLGLYVSARLMREQGGNLWVEDRSGGGAVFVVALPARAPEEIGLGPAAVRGVAGGAVDERDEIIDALDGDGLAADSGNPDGLGLG